MKTPRILFFILILLSSLQVYGQKVGLLMDSYFLDRWYMDEKYLKEKISELGGECIVEMPNGDADEQVRLGHKLIDSGIDVLILIASDGQKSTEIVSAAKAKNIPVIAYDRFIKSNDLAYYISFNNVLVGKLQALYALNKVPQGNYLLINGPVSDNNAILFREGQLSRLKGALDSGKVTLIGDIVLNDWSEMEAMMKADEFFTKSKVMPDVIIAGNDALATGALQSLPQKLLAKVVVVGQDAEVIAVKNIIKGHQAMTIYKPIKALAYQAGEVAMQLARKQPITIGDKFRFGGVEVNAIFLEPVIVDKDNYEATVVKDGHINLTAPKKK